MGELQTMTLKGGITMSELNNCRVVDYENKVEIEVRTDGLIEAEDMKIIQSAPEAIIKTAEKYFDYGDKDYRKEIDAIR